MDTVVQKPSFFFRILSRTNLILFLILFLGLSLYYGGKALTQYEHDKRYFSSSDQAISVIGNLADISREDTSDTVLSTVTDETLLQDYPLKGVRNDDRVLIFRKSYRYIVYRPSTNSIVIDAVYRPE